MVDTSDPLYNEFQVLSQNLGMDELLIQGAGGNTSIKIENTLWIKASGKWLLNTLKENLFVAIEIKKTKDYFEKYLKEKIFINKKYISELRPSIETLMHVIIDKKFVIHLHCIDTITHCITKDSCFELSKKLNDIDWAYIPYRKPGLELAIEIYKIIKKDNSIPSVFILGNHGLVISDNDINKMTLTLKNIQNALKIKPRKLIKPNLKKLNYVKNETQFKLPKYDISHAISTDKIGSTLLSRGSLIPDQVVFLGVGISNIELNQNFKNKLINNVNDTFISISDYGILVRKNISLGSEEMLKCLGNIFLRIQKGSKINFLEESHEKELINWESEKYRANI